MRKELQGREEKRKESLAENLGHYSLLLKKEERESALSLRSKVPIQELCFLGNTARTQVPIPIQITKERDKTEVFFFISAARRKQEERPQEKEASQVAIFLVFAWVQQAPLHVKEDMDG